MKELELMIKGLLPILYTGAGVLAVGVVGYAVLSPQLDEDPKPVEIVETKPEPVENEVASLPDETVQPETEAKEPEKPAPQLPTFTLLRVEKDGSSVIAGSGPANSEVSLFDGDEEIATTVAGPTGDFAFVLDNPLSPGPHELHLSATPKDGDSVRSAEAGLINIPKPEADEEPTVLVSEAGQATRVLQKPEPAKTQADVTAEASETVEVAKSEEPKPAVEPTPEPVVETTPETDTEAAEIPKPEPETAPEPTREQEQETAAVQPEVDSDEEPAVEQASEPPAPAQVLIEAADIEGGRIFIAGTGEPGKTVSIYLENKLLGSTSIGPNGAFLYEGDHRIEPGRYSIRADMADRAEGKVAARAEVKLIHEPQVVAEAEQPEPEPVEPVEPVQEQAEATPTDEPKPVGDQANELSQTAESDSVEPSQSGQAEETKTAEGETSPVTQDVAAIVEPEEESVPEIRTGSAVIIRRGDNLWQVARRNYGAGIRYTTIFEANRDQVRDPDLIYPGQVLKVPESDQDSSDTSNG